MFKYIRENQKKVMAIVGVVLMIAFFVPPTFRGFTGDDEHAVGAIGNELIKLDQVQKAQNEFRYLMQHLVFQAQATGEHQWQPLLSAMLPRYVIEQITENDEMYCLLLWEAKRLGFAPDLELARRRLADRGIALVMPDGRVLPASDAEQENPRFKATVEYCLANFLMIRQAFLRAAQAVKISQPMLMHELAGQFQQLKANVIDFAARDYEDRVPAPTIQQLQEHFDRYANFEAGSRTGPDNPFGFGYKYPNRIKFQYICIPRSQVRKTVLASKDDYTWEVEAQRYYLTHQHEFPATQPATTQEALSLGSVQQSGPTTRPFEQVRQHIIDMLVEPLCERLQRQIQAELSSRLNQDFVSYQKSPDSVSPAYDSFEYLQTLAGQIESRHRVTLKVASFADEFRSARQLRELPGIGQARDFADSAIALAEAFLPAGQTGSPNALSLFEPSKPIVSEGDQDVYFYRITAAEPSHRPVTLDEVRNQVERDWRRSQAYELAKADALKKFELAKVSGLESAADGRKILTTGAFHMSTTIPIENYPLSTPAQEIFISRLREMLGMLQQGNYKPVTLVEMPSDWKVAIVELLEAESDLKKEFQELAESELAFRLQEQYRILAAADWFRFDSLVKRLGYQDRTGRHRAASTQNAS